MKCLVLVMIWVCVLSRLQKKKGLKMIGDSKRAELMVNLSRNKPKTIKSLIYDIEGSSTIVFLRNKYHYHSPNLESFNHM
jgi:hypothetical protein